MTDEEILKRLESVELDDIEFKAAKTAAPKSALATVSAFANTGGGHIVMGVSEVDDALKITGVEKVDKVQREFTSLLRDQKKISLAFSVEPTVHHIDGKTLICFYIPEAQRGDKPVYLDGDIAKTYVRRGAENCRCTRTELSEFIRNDGGPSYDAHASREDLVGQVEREHRNPRIVTAFERIGLSDQRGGGLKKIFEDWREFRYFPPEIENNKGDMTFRLRLSTERLLDDERYRQATPTVQTRLAAFIRRKGKMDIVDLRALTGFPDIIALEAADALVDLGIARRTAGASPVFHLGLYNDAQKESPAAPRLDFRFIA